MSDTGQAETPLGDHVDRFWKLLRNEHVFVRVDMRRDHDEGQPPHWDTACFSDDVAKACVDEIDQLRAKVMRLRAEERGKTK